MSTIKKLMMTAAGGEALAIEDVFSTYLYTGNGSTQTITNGIDLAGEGGLVWAKRRNGVHEHGLYDTERGSGKRLSSDSNSLEETDSNGVSSFNADGFTHGSADDIGGNADTYASWTFRKAPRFFDVVTYTGNGTAGRTVSHNLGSTPGCIIIKGTSSNYEWSVYHRGMDSTAPEDYFMWLNHTYARFDNTGYWNDTAPTSTQFTLGNNGNVNASGQTYVAYLFAHDPLGPSGDGSDGLIACGSYSGSSSDFLVDLGWEPQWLMIKSTTQAQDWVIFDNMRGLTDTSSERLIANSSSAAANSTAFPIPISANGFNIDASNVSGAINFNGHDYIYIAIRRGPMRQPESGTEVYSAFQRSGGSGVKNTTGWPIDAQWVDMYNLSSGDFWVDRLRGVSTTSTESGNYLNPQSTSAETSIGCTQAWDSTGYVIPSYISGAGNHMEDCFRRAPGFFDVVAYTGNSTSNRAISHNLSVVPEMVWIKCRSDGQSWVVDHKDLSSGQELYLNAATAATTQSPATFGTHTSSTFNLVDGTEPKTNYTGQTFIAYLFATLPGVSKVGSYTGNGTSQTIDCGFTSGARFILIKRTDSAGNWCKYNYALGINAGTEQVIRLDQDFFSTADVSAADEVDPDASGFIVNQLSTNNLNVSGGTYIYLAIA